MNPRQRKEVDESTYSGRFAIRLKALRMKAKLTLEEASEQIGISVTAIYNWEAGRKRPDIEKFPKISEVYKVKKTKDLLPNE